MNAVELKNVIKTYGDYRLSIENLSLPVGYIMGLVGENGAGKSTVMKLILGMIAPDGGEIRVLGQNVDKDFARVREDIGVVLDEPAFPDCLCAKQVSLIMKNIYKNWDAQEFFSLLHRFSIPENKAFKEFSRGTKMKLSIAVALSHKAKLLILDEPTSGLDPVVRDEVVDIFYEFTRDERCSVLISSHIVSDLEKLCDYIAFIHKGKLLLCEEKDRLLEEYCLIQCDAKELESIPTEAIKGKRGSSYGVSAIVHRGGLPAGMSSSQINIEDLFILMAKEDMR